MKISSKWLLLSVFLPGIALGASLAADSIVAVVGNDVITQLELKKRYKSVEAQLKRQGTPMPHPLELENQLLERLIMDKAQLQKAKEAGLFIDDATLQAGLKRLASNNHLSEEAFQKTIESEGLNWAEFKEEIRDEMLIARLRETEVDSRIQISDAEVDNYLKQQQNTSQMELDLAHIVMRIPEEASQEEINRIQKRAQTVRKRLAEGENFAQLSAAFSDAPDALSGGKMGLRPISQLPQLYIDAVENLEMGGISEVWRSPAGFHIVQLLNRKGAQVIEEQERQLVEQTHARHILIRVNELVSEEQARQTLNEVLRQLSVGEKFETLAKRYSQDASAANGGDLGWVNPGDTVPPFEKAMNLLNIGEVSPIIQTPFGLHLIEVLERRQEDVTDDRTRQLAKRDLHLRRLDETYQDWLRQLRDNTYVEIRPREELDF